MKNIYSVSILLLIFLIIACQQKKEEEQINVQQETKSEKTVFKAPEATAEFLQALFEVQQEIMLDPANRKLKEKFIFNAYIANNNALITLGAGRLTNPENGEKINNVMVKRAAMLDAKRWATYGLLWMNNDFQPDFGKISEIHQTEFEQILQFQKGDSLIIAIASKVR